MRERAPPKSLLREIRRDALSDAECQPASAAKQNETTESLSKADGLLLGAGIIAPGRVGVPDDIGPMIASLLIKDNRWIKAQRIEVSGGQVI